MTMIMVNGKRKNINNACATCKHLKRSIFDDLFNRVQVVYTDPVIFKNS